MKDSDQASCSVCCLTVSLEHTYRTQAPKRLVGQDMGANSRRYGSECSKIARFSAISAAIFTAPPQNCNFKAPRYAISLRSTVASERRLSLRLERIKLILIAEFRAIPESADQQWLKVCYRMVMQMHDLVHSGMRLAIVCANRNASNGSSFCHGLFCSKFCVHCAGRVHIKEGIRQHSPKKGSLKGLRKRFYEGFLEGVLHSGIEREEGL